MRTAMFKAALMLAIALPTWADAAESLRDVFKRVSGSVVVVHTEGKPLGATGNQAGNARIEGLGSGVLVTAGGKVLTAAHVVEAADRVSVRFPDGQTVGARVLAADPTADLALLQVQEVPRGVFVAPLGDSDRVDVADEVFVVGAPYGISQTLTVGHISARRAASTEPGAPAQIELFQTDAAISQGNSGGPMFNRQGEVIGIVSHIVSRTGGSEGIGFAVASNSAKDLLEAPSFWTGLSVVPLFGDLAGLLNVPQAAGLLVTHTAEGSPAAQLGIRAGTAPAMIGNVNLVLGGDVILRVAGLPIEAHVDNFRRVRDRLRKARPDEQLVVVVLRAGRIVELRGASAGQLRSN